MKLSDNTVLIAGGTSGTGLKLAYWLVALGNSRMMTTLPPILPDAALDVFRLKMLGMPVKFGAGQPA
jgi:NAD(P)-dependent dehydrogenase (short-subunit alcohol dehydrogenase family)